jgi:DNA-directed RNA polymerase specialized sigma24 family protein
MSNPVGSITRLIPDVLNRDEHAIEQLWRRYVARVEGVARPVIAGLSPGAGDEQDVAQSAFRAFFEAAAAGQAPQLESRNELWSLLATIARHKAADRVRYALRDRRGGAARQEVSPTLDLPADEPSPSETVALQEVLDGLLGRLDALGDLRLKTIALMRLEGAAVSEIAAELDCTPRTIQRKLHILERLWTNRDP